jgi:hypothetical protein
MREDAAGKPGARHTQTAAGAATGGGSDCSGAALSCAPCGVPARPRATVVTTTLTQSLCWSLTAPSTSVRSAPGPAAIIARSMMKGVPRSWWHCSRSLMKVAAARPSYSLIRQFATSLNEAKRARSASSPEGNAMNSQPLGEAKPREESTRNLLMMTLRHRCCNRGFVARQEMW